MLHSNISNNIPIVSKDETDSESKGSKGQEKGQPVYFLSIICNPKILADPHNTKQRFSSDLWSSKQIKSIKQMPQFLQISLNEKKTLNIAKPSEIYKNQITSQYNQSNQQYQKELLNCHNNYNNEIHLLKKIQSERPSGYRQHQFEKWVKSMIGKNFVGFFIPLRNEGPKFRKFIISKQTLRMLGYEPQQFSIEMQKYTQLAADFWSNQAYRQIFLNYITSFRKFMSMEIHGDITVEECIKESTIIIFNQMRGKNDAKIKVQMKVYLPNMYTICYEFLRVVQQNEYKDNQINQYRNNILSQANKTTFHSLSSITRLPKDINPANTNKICSYVIIREPCIVEDADKPQKSGSEYELSQQR